MQDPGGSDQTRHKDIHLSTQGACQWVSRDWKRRWRGVSDITDITWRDLRDVTPCDIRCDITPVTISVDPQPSGTWWYARSGLRLKTRTSAPLGTIHIQNARTRHSGLLPLPVGRAATRQTRIQGVLTDNNNNKMRETAPSVVY